MSITADRAALKTAVAAVTGFTARVELAVSREDADRLAGIDFGADKRAAIGPGADVFPGPDVLSIVIPVWVYLTSSNADAGDLDTIVAAVRTACTGAGAGQATLEETFEIANFGTCKKLRFLVNTYWAT